MSAELLDDVTILAMRLCATRHDAMVSGEAFIGLLSKLLRTAVGEALAAAAKPPTWNAVDYHSARADLTPLAEPTVDKPAAPGRSVAAPAVGTAPVSLSGVPAPSQTRGRDGKPKVSEADREQLRIDYLALIANGGKPPRGWQTAQARRLGISDSGVDFILRPLRPKPNAHTVPATTDVAQLAVVPAAPRSKPRPSSVAAPREPVIAPPDEEPAPTPKRKPAPKHRELTAEELTELTRRCDIVTNNRALSIPYDWARQRGEELGVPATTIFSALTKSTKPRKERDPVKALEAPQPRVRRMYGNNYGGANE